MLACDSLKAKKWLVFHSMTGVVGGGEDLA